MKRSFLVTSNIHTKQTVYEGKDIDIMFSHRNTLRASTEEEICIAVCFNVIIDKLSSREFNKIESIKIERVQLLVDLYPEEDEINNWKLDFSSYKKDGPEFFIPKETISEAIKHLQNENVMSHKKFNELLKNLTC